MDKFFFDKILNLLFPPKCGYCNSITMNSHFICDNCRDLSTKKYTNVCKFCGKVCNSKMCLECSSKTLYYEKLIFCSEYNEEFKSKMHAYKFSDKKYLYHFFAELMIERIKCEEFDLIIPVPISKERNKERGYNQSALIAKEVSKNLNKEYRDDILVKIKNSERQSMQKYKERQENVKNMFKVADILGVKDRKVLLIDDIFTTGATANECSRVLKISGAKNIKIAVICASHMLK